MLPVWLFIVLLTALGCLLFVTRITDKELLHAEEDTELKRLDLSNYETVE